MAHSTRTTTPQSAVEQQPTTWIGRVNLGRQMRDAGEKMVADALRERLDKVGETRWLKECESEWGWSRSTAYRHLNPAQMEAAREATRESRANVPTVGTFEPEPAVPGTVEISASQRGKRRPVEYTVSWNEPDGGSSYQSGYRTLEEAMTFCPCSFDPDKIERVVIPGVFVQNLIPRDMLGHAGGYRIDENGVKIPGSEMAPDLRPYEDDGPAEDEEPETESALDPETEPGESWFTEYRAEVERDQERKRLLDEQRREDPETCTGCNEERCPDCQGTGWHPAERVPSSDPVDVRQAKRAEFRIWQKAETEREIAEESRLATAAFSELSAIFSTLDPAVGSRSDWATLRSNIENALENAREIRDSKARA
jgi:hypothetical protein